MMNIYCDDGSTNVKLAWFAEGTLNTSISANSFRHGWKVADFGANAFNYQAGLLKYTCPAESRPGRHLPHPCSGGHPARCRDHWGAV